MLVKVTAARTRFVMDVFNALTGAWTFIDAERLSGLNEVISFISNKEGIPPKSIVLLLSPSAKALRDNDIYRGQTVFLYDRRLLSKGHGSIDQESHKMSDTSKQEDVTETHYRVDSIEQLNQMSMVQRRNWSRQIRDESEISCSRIDTLRVEINVIYQAIQLALSHMIDQTKREQKLVTNRSRMAQRVVEEIQQCDNWESILNFVNSEPTLSKFLVQKAELKEIRQKASAIEDYRIKLVELLDEIKDSMNLIHQQSSSLMAENEVFSNGPDVTIIKTDIAALAAKISLDADRCSIDGAEDTQKMERMKRHQDTEILPELAHAASDMILAERQWTEAKRQVQQQLVSTLQEISDIQQKSAKMHRLLEEISRFVEKADKEKLVVAQLIDLPFLYGVLQIESVRRRSWVDEVSRHLQIISDRIVSSRNSELRRVDRWLKHYNRSPQFNRLLSFLKISDFPSLFFSIKCDSDYLPVEDINVYLGLLKSHGLNDIYEDLKSEYDAMTIQLQNNISDPEPQFGMLTSSQSHDISSDLRISTLRNYPAAQRSIQFSDPKILKVVEQDSSTMKRQQELSEREEQLENSKIEVQTLLAEAQRLKSDLILKEDALTAREKALALAAKAVGPTSCVEYSSKLHELMLKTQEVSKRLEQSSSSIERVLNAMGLQSTVTFLSSSSIQPFNEEIPKYDIRRVKGLSRRSNVTSGVCQPNFSGWPQNNMDITNERFRDFLNKIHVDYKVFAEAAIQRFNDVERLARKLRQDVRSLQESLQHSEQEISKRLAINTFKPGDLILLLPMREPSCKPSPWAVFNAGELPYFLDPEQAPQDQSLEYLIARASSVEPRLVVQTRSADNPYNLPEGTRWYMISIEK